MGFFIESSGGTIRVVERVGSVDTGVSQASWVDTLNGTGPSGANVDFSKAQIFLFDMEWLGVGQVRCAVVQGGAIHYYYTFTHINTLTAPYIPMAKLPIRYEIRSTGGAGSMRMICGTVISEGGITPLGRQFSYGMYTSGSKLTIPVDATKFYPLIALRIRPENRFCRVTFKLKDINIFALTNNTWGSWKILLNPTITNAGSWQYVDISNESAVQYMDILKNGANEPITEASGGFVLYSDYYTTRTNSVIVSSTDELVAAFPITMGLNGIQDTVVLVTNTIAAGGGGNSCDVLANIKWIEFM